MALFKYRCGRFGSVYDYNCPNNLDLRDEWDKEILLSQIAEHYHDESGCDSFEWPIEVCVMDEKEQFLFCGNVNAEQTMSYIAELEEREE